jgi:hypothetical protein
VTFVVLVIMDYAKFITIDWVAIKAFLGMTEPTDFNLLINNAFAWIKEHLIIFIAAVVGFIVGYKLG